MYKVHISWYKVHIPWYKVHISWYKVHSKMLKAVISGTIHNALLVTLTKENETHLTANHVLVSILLESEDERLLSVSLGHLGGL